MMVVSDIEDVFVPLVDGFLVSPQEARSVVDRYVQTGLMIFLAVTDHSHLCKKMYSTCPETVFFTITAEILAQSLANFYRQYVDRHMNLKFM